MAKWTLPLAIMVATVVTIPGAQADLNGQRDDPANRIWYFEPAAAQTAQAALPPLPETAAGLKAYLDEHFPASESVLRYTQQRAAELTAMTSSATASAAPGKAEAGSAASARLGPQWVLDTFYAPLRDLHPSVLTYKPKVDCNHGRYLIIDVSKDGFGISAASMILKLFFQLDTNLTGVARPFESNHADESSEDQNRFWGFDEWEVQLADLENCPESSPVWQNYLDLSASKQSVAERKDEILKYASELSEKGVGGVLRLQTAGWFFFNPAYRQYVLDHQWLVEVRWHCHHLFDPITFSADPRGPRLFNAPAALVPPPPLPPLRLHMSVHVRRGDIMDAASGSPIPTHADRYYPLTHFIETANALLSILEQETPGLPRQLLTITIYSEGVPDDFAPLVHNFVDQGYHTVLNLDTKTSRVFASLADSDIQVFTPKSAFSIYSAMHFHRLRVGGDWAGLGPPAGFTVLTSHESRVLHASVAQKARVRSGQLWRFLVEWKLRRQLADEACQPRTLACLIASPYLLSPLGPIAADFITDQPVPPAARMILAAAQAAAPAAAAGGAIGLNAADVPAAGLSGDADGATRPPGRAAGARADVDADAANALRITLILLGSTAVTVVLLLWARLRGSHLRSSRPASTARRRVRPD